MNIVLWVLQGVLAFLCVSGGFFKLAKTDELMKTAQAKAFPAVLWKLVGVVEIVGGLLLIVPGAIGWMPELTGCAALVLAVENLLLSAHNARFSRKLSAANPLVWSAVMMVLAAIVAYGRYTAVA